MIIYRYLKRDIHLTLTVVTAVLLLIFLCNQFVRYLSRAAAGKMAVSVVLKIMAIQIPYLLGLLLPAGFFLGVLLVYGRMYTDNEMTVLSSCGVSTRQMLWFTLRSAIGVMLVVGFLILWLNPQLMAYQLRLKAASPAESLLQTAMPGRFQIMPGGKQVYYIEDIARHHKSAKQVFVAEQEKDHQNSSSDGHRWSVLFAGSAKDEVSREGDMFIVAKQGYRYFGVPGERDFRVVAFDEYGLRLDNQAPNIRKPFLAMSNMQLWQQRERDKHAWPELQWRILMPLSVPVLAILAVPLSYVSPRQGRYAKLLPAILLYVIYANMMFVARDWVEQGSLSPMIGLWWLPGALLVIALAMLWKRRV